MGSRMGRRVDQLRRGLSTCCVAVALAAPGMYVVAEDSRVVGGTSQCGSVVYVGFM